MSRTRPASGIAHRSTSGVVARSVNGEPRIRRHLEPGDIGAIAALHGRLYALEHGLDLSFECDLARALYAAAARGWPSDAEGVWVVERAGAVAGSLALTDEGDRTGRVRAFLLAPSLRGRGIGRRLLDELLERSRAAGYGRLSLTTFSDLDAAARLYTERGFVLVDEEVGPRWGMARMTFQRYELGLEAFQRRAQARSSWSTGSSASPFFVSE